LHRFDEATSLRFPEEKPNVFGCIDPRTGGGIVSNQALVPAVALTPDQLLAHWQGHRRLTRRVIEAFPEDQLFMFSVGGMRPFAALALEMLGMGSPMLNGFVTEQWETYAEGKAANKAELLQRWDAETGAIDRLWSQLPGEIFQEIRTAFGQYTGQVYDLILYVVDNEIHHRAQGYVYLRALGIEPPPFWERN
jgi:uncharacterized damage-inducible protein DinB